MNGYQGQLRASDYEGRTFPVKQELINLIQEESSIPISGLKKLSVFTLQGTRMQINEKEIRIGKTGIYEIEDVEITSFQFLDNVSSQTIIDFIIYE